MAAVEGADLPGVPQVGDAGQFQNRLMMFGSNLLQFGGALIMGPCLRRRSNVAIVVMIGDMLYDDYMAWHIENIDRLERFYPGTEIGGLPSGGTRKYFVPHDSRYSFVLPPPIEGAPEWTEPLGYTIGDDYWYGVPENAGLVGSAFWPTSELTYSLKNTFPAYGTENLEMYIRFKLFWGRKRLPSDEGVNAYVWQRIVQRKVVLKIPPEDFRREDYPPDDETHYYGDNVFVEIEPDYKPMPATPTEKIDYAKSPWDTWFKYDVETLPNWNPSLTGDVPTLAACTFDESGKIKEIIWRSK